MQFEKLWTKYPGTQRKYSASQVYHLIGGKVLYNHLNIPIGFQNSCALRLSRALNYGGKPIPFIRQQTGSGSDNKWYFYKIKHMVPYLKKVFGEPKIVKERRAIDLRDAFQGQQGIIWFDIRWPDATGHVTLWDGKRCGDKCYFDDDKMRKVSLWVIKN